MTSTESLSGAESDRDGPLEAERAPTSLSEIDLHAWVRAVAQQPTGPDDLTAWLQGPLKEFFPFEALVLAYGELVAGEVRVTNMLSCGHAPEYLEQIGATFDLKQRGSLQRWLVTREPFYIDPRCPPAFASAFELKEIEDFNLKNVAGHGVLNIKANAGSYFGFSGVREPLGEWHCAALGLIAPYLNAWFLSHATQAGESNLCHRLTERQKVIARLLASGLNDKAIARHLGISEKTVRNQLTEAYARVGVHKRTQLMALLK